MAENQEDVQQNEVGQDGKTKIDNQFDETIVKLSSLIGGENIPKGKKLKVPNDAIERVTEKLLKSRTESAEKKLEEDVSNLLDEIISYNGKIEDAKKLMNKTIQDEKKALIEKARKIFDQVENMDALRAKYVETLRQAAK